MLIKVRSLPKVICGAKIMIMKKTTFASIAWLDNIKTILIVTSHQKIILFQFDV